VEVANVGKRPHTEHEEDSSMFPALDLDPYSEANTADTADAAIVVPPGVPVVTITDSPPG
jgi:hypothetical protein